MSGAATLAEAFLPQKKPLLGLTEPLDSPDNPDCQIYQSAAAERTFERDLEGNRPRFQPLSLGVHRDEHVPNANYRII